MMNALKELLKFLSIKGKSKNKTLMKEAMIDIDKIKNMDDFLKYKFRKEYEEFNNKR